MTSLDDENLLYRQTYTLTRIDVAKGNKSNKSTKDDDKKTTVNVYSLRAKDRPTVSTPVTWAEVETAVRKKKLLSFDFAAVLERVQAHGDLFAPVLTLKQKLPPVSALRSRAAGGK